MIDYFTQTPLEEVESFIRGDQVLHSVAEGGILAWRKVGKSRSSHCHEGELLLGGKIWQAGGCRLCFFDRTAFCLTEQKGDLFIAHEFINFVKQEGEDYAAGPEGFPDLV